MLIWKIVGGSKVSVLYIYIDYLYLCLKEKLREEREDIYLCFVLTTGLQFIKNKDIW